MQATVRIAYGNRTRELSLMLRAWVKVGTSSKLDKASAVVTLAQYSSHCVCVAGMSFQVSILKILAGQPDGRASMDVVKQYLAVLYTSGPEWVARTKCLAERAPELDIFSQKLVAREPGEWRITEEGKAPGRARASNRRPRGANPGGDDRASPDVGSSASSHSTATAG